MRLDKLTSKFQLALADAQSLAVGQDHQFIEPVHLMVALLDQQGGSVRGLLTKSGVNVNLLRSQLGESIDRLAKVEGAGGEVHIGAELSKLFNITDKLAQEREDQYISSELFVLAAMDGKSPLKGALEQAGAVKGAIEKSIDDLRGGHVDRQRNVLVSISIFIDNQQLLRGDIRDPGLHGIDPIGPLYPRPCRALDPPADRRGGPFRQSHNQSGHLKGRKDRRFGHEGRYQYLDTQNVGLTDGDLVLIGGYDNSWVLRPRAHGYHTQQQTDEHRRHPHHSAPRTLSSKKREARKSPT